MKLNIFSLFLAILISTTSLAQTGHVSLSQDQNIPVLLDLKKKMNKDDNNSDRYKIQIYSGNRSAAEKAKTNFKETFGSWDASIEYETPNFKIWVGNFITRLDADRALKKIKKEFSSAFIFKPKKEKK